jgi:hypothetical protein
MYTMFHIRYWSIAHLNACCWYIDCRKVLCPVEEENAKKACVQADSKGDALAPNQGEVQEDEVEVDINLHPEKERNKILNHKTREPKRAKARADKEAQKVKDKIERDAKKGERSGKSKTVVASTPSLVLP